MSGRPCTRSGKRVDLDLHLTECLHEVVPCGLVDTTDDANCCGVKLPRSKMDAHRDVCQFQRGRCQFCGKLAGGSPHVHTHLRTHTHTHTHVPVHTRTHVNARVYSLSTFVRGALRKRF